MKLADLGTPALILDRAVLAANCAAMSARMAALGVALRPHMKTAKSIDVARVALGETEDGITVSTLREAAYFIAGGIRDVTYAVGIAPAKLDQVAALEQGGARLTVLTDDLGVAGAIAARGAALGHAFRVLIEIDSGGGRGGVMADGAELLALGEALHGAGGADGAELAGVLTHAGHSYDCRGGAEIRAVAEAERATVVGAAERLRRAGLPCPTVSVGSTPTARYAERLDGVTEARPGVYMFSDLYQVGIGVGDSGDIACSVLASVIGQRPEKGLILIDAGALALSQDRSTAALEHDSGFGLVFDALAREAIADLRVARVNQEHGMVEGAGDAAPPFDALPVGARVRVLPNHACMTAAMFDRYHVTDGGDEVIAEWPRCNGW